MIADSTKTVVTGEHLTPENIPADDPGRLVCPHDRELRTHYLGGGIWVCFACWCRMLLAAPPAKIARAAARIRRQLTRKASR